LEIHSVLIRDPEIRLPIRRGWQNGTADAVRDLDRVFSLENREELVFGKVKRPDEGRNMDGRQRSYPTLDIRDELSGYRRIEEKAQSTLAQAHGFSFFPKKYPDDAGGRRIRTANVTHEEILTPRVFIGQPESLRIWYWAVFSIG
jgi:hypothetical protein